MFDLVPATEAHALDLLSDISLQSSDDYASLGLDPSECALDILQKSVCAFAGLIDGRCFCLFGVVPDSLTATSGEPWLLTSVDIARSKIAFAKASRQYIPYLRNRFTFLHGWVYERNTVSIKWLKWLGYTLAPAPSLATNGRAYYAFEWNA
jgi:hypothetical protein